MAKFDIKSEATKSLHAGVGVVDLAVETVRDYVSDVTKRVNDLQKETQGRITSVSKSVTDFDFKPEAIRKQAVTVFSSRVEALTDEAKARRSAIETRVAELQGEAQKQLDDNVATATATYSGLVQRGEVLVARIRGQESTKAAATQAKTTASKAKATRTQATKATKKTTTSAKKTTSTAKKTAKKSSAPAKKSAKATSTAAKKTATSAAKAAGDAATKVGD